MLSGIDSSNILRKLRVFLTDTWAAKLDSIRSGLSDARMSNLDNISSTRMSKVDSISTDTSTTKASTDTLLTRLTNAWAAKLDGLRSDVTTTRAGYLDLIPGINAVAGARPLKGRTLNSTNYSKAGACYNASNLGTLAANAWTGTINITGAGALRFFAYSGMPAGSPTHTLRVRLIIDGVQTEISSQSFAQTGYQTNEAVGTTQPLSAGSGFVYSSLVPASYECLVFNTSLQIQVSSSVVMNGTMYGYVIDLY